VVSKLYQGVDHEVYVKISDTSQAPFMRDPVIRRLDANGNAEAGFVHGRMVAGQPAVAQYFASTNNSQVSVLIGNRYLVEVRVSNAKSPSEALDILKELPLSALAKER
jgi:hypothetical protein